MRIAYPMTRSKWAWHRWFAWRPVRLGTVLVWLEMIERQRLTEYWHPMTKTWQYRFEVEVDDS